MNLILRITRQNINELAGKVVDKIMNDGLGNSTLKDMHPKAYEELRGYRADMENDVANVLERELVAAIIDIV